MSVIEILLACLGLSGQTMVSKGYRQGFMLWLLGCLVAMLFFYNHKMFGMMAVQALYALLNIYALLRPATDKREVT